MTEEYKRENGGRTVRDIYFYCFYAKRKMLELVQPHQHGIVRQDVIHSRHFAGELPDRHSRARAPRRW